MMEEFQDLELSEDDSRQYTFDTQLVQLYKIRYPIVLSPMSGTSGGRLAATVTKAGGIGIIGAGFQPPEWLLEQWNIATTILNPNEFMTLGIGLCSFYLREKPTILDLALQLKPRIIWLSFGDIDPYVDKIKNAGCSLFCQVNSVSEALHVYRLGADVIIAQGTESGGYGRDLSTTFCLVPEIVQAVGARIPVLAAGGVVDGRGLLSALALGASGAVMGTRFMVTTESLSDDLIKKCIVALSTQPSGGVTQRINWGPQLMSGLPEEFTARAISHSDYQPIWAGEGSRLIKDIPSASVIVERTVNEAIEQLDNLSKVLLPTP